jgi:Sigma-70, region 4
VSGRLDDVARIKALHRALADLPGPELEVLALCVWSGLGYAEAAEALRVPVGTIRSRLSRARAKLARLTEVELVFRATTFTDGQAPGSGFDLYTDSGPYYWAPTESGLPAQIAAHHNLGDGLFTREIAAAEYAVNGDLATARERMAYAPAPANAGKSPAAQMSPTLLKVKAELLGVKAAPGQSLAAAYDKAYIDSWVWSDATDALEAGAGNPQVRAGVLRLLSTVSGVVVTHGTLDGQPTLVVGDVTPGLNGNGTSEGAMTLNASTGVPLKYTDGAVGKTPESTTTYTVSRVTVAAIAAGKF